jgi:hypothetical protein
MSTQEATHTQAKERVFQARIGKRPIVLPKGVSATLKDRNVEIKGPKGTLKRELPPNTDVKIDAAGISRAATGRASRASRARSWRPRSSACPRATRRRCSSSAPAIARS